MRYRILGPLQVDSGAGSVALGSAKQRALLAALLLRANEPVTAERLAQMLWGPEASAKAVSTVQVYVSRLRKVLPADADLATTPAGYVLRVARDELDAIEFAHLAAAGRDALARGDAESAGSLLRRALGLWRGPPLAELSYEPFAQTEIARLEEERLAAIEARIDADLAAGRHAEMVGELQALAAAHPLRERLHGQLILALYRSGRQADALAAYGRAREILVEELGIEPGPALRELHASVLGQAPSLDGSDTGHSARAAMPRSLPALMNATYGRRLDVETVGALIERDDVRLVTVTGPGGVGKTRLALEVAHALSERFGDGVAFVDLTALAGPELVTDAVVRALGAVRQAGETAGQTLARFLAHKRMLLVLDNFEHVLDAAQEMAAAVAPCEEVKILATSREPLHVRFERRYVLAPLATPDAAALFRDRGELRGEEDDPAIDEICDRLDGLPLAVELTAARTSVLSPRELAARLDDVLETVATGPRDAPVRQRTLRATLDWSFELLDEAERAAFARFSVFAGGATVGSAQAVTGASLDLLGALSAKSLITRAGDRLRMLEPVRQYAERALDRMPDADAVREAHASHFLQLAEAAEPELPRAGRTAWLRRLEAEDGNLRAALEWAVSRRRAELGLRLSAALAEFWLAHAARAEGERWVTAALDLADEAGSPAWRAKALLARGRLVDPHCSGGLGARSSAERDAEAALALYSEMDDRSGVARSLTLLSELAGAAGDWSRARTRAGDAVTVAGETGDEVATGRALAAAAGAAKTLGDAWPLLRDATARLRAAGDDGDLAAALSRMAFFAISQERYAEAAALLDDAMPAARAVEAPDRVAAILGNQGLAALFRDAVGEAACAFAAQLELCRDHVLAQMAPEGLAGMAAVAARSGDGRRAALLYGAAAGLGFAAEGAEARVYGRLIDTFIAPAQRAEDAGAWRAQEAFGRRMPLREAIDEALSPLAAAPVGHGLAG